MEDTAKAIQYIVYRSLVKYEETAKVIQCTVYCPLVLHGNATEDTAKAIQCIVYLPVVSHEETTKAIQFILYRSLVLPQLKFAQFLVAQQAYKKNCKHERVSTALVYSMYMCLTIDAGTLFNNSTEKLKDTR